MKTYLRAKKTDTTTLSHFTSISRKRRLSREESSFFTNRNFSRNVPNQVDFSHKSNSL